MNRVTLYRGALNANYSQGAIMHGTSHVCFTLERPWLNNKRKISCIPAGFYECKFEEHSRLKGVLRVNGVPKRSGILIHAANFVDQLEGCIAPGEYFSAHNSSAGLRLMICESRRALSRLIYLFEPDGRLGLDVVNME